MRTRIMSAVAMSTAVIVVGAVALTVPAAASAATKDVSHASLHPNVSKAYYFQNVTYTVHVTDTTHPSRVPSGTVTFQVNSGAWVTLGTRTLSHGSATLTAPNNNYPAQDMPVRAVYRGSSASKPATSNVVDVTSLFIPTKLYLSPTTVHRGQQINVKSLPDLTNIHIPGFHPPAYAQDGFFDASEGSADYPVTQPAPPAGNYTGSFKAPTSVGTHHITLTFCADCAAEAGNTVYENGDHTFTVHVVP
jgi:hypothetical protein